MTIAHALSLDSAEPGLVGDYVRAALASNTRRAYRADLDHFRGWGGTLPATDRMIAEYLAAHAGKLAVATLERRLATLARAHREYASPNPAKAEIVRLVMQGIRRVHGSVQRRVTPLLWEDLEAIVADMDETTTDMRDRAVLLIGFAGAFRRSELVALNCTDLDWQAEGVLVTVRRSKTDPYGKERELAIPKGVGQKCPVRALRDWLDRAGIGDGPVFRPVTRCGRVLPQRLSPEAVVRIVKRRVHMLGRDPRTYSGHSLRAGFATSAAVAGVPTWRVRQQTGHSSTEMLGRYIREGGRFAQNAATAVLTLGDAACLDRQKKASCFARLTESSW